VKVCVLPTHSHGPSLPMPFHSLTYGTCCVQIEVHHKAVQPANLTGKGREQRQAVHREIARMQPFTMSWSNVCDYYSPSQFHEMAKACSGVEDTVHYGYSMNWPSRVKGACWCVSAGIDVRALVAQALMCAHL
jgi:hypothetical protein